MILFINTNMDNCGFRTTTVQYVRAPLCLCTTARLSQRDMVWGIINWRNTALKSVVKYHYIFWVILCIPVLTADVIMGDVG